MRLDQPRGPLGVEQATHGKIRGGHGGGHRVEHEAGLAREPLGGALGAVERLRRDQVEQSVGEDQHFRVERLEHRVERLALAVGRLERRDRRRPDRVAVLHGVRVSDAPERLHGRLELVAVVQVQG